VGDVAIRLEGVSKYYKLYNSPNDRFKEALNPFGKVYHKKYYALKDINLEINKGEILGVVGKNGCGKSTLLKLISSILTPNEGGITVRGKISALLELGSGFNPDFTGLQNIFFYGAIIGISRERMDEKLDDIVAFAEIDDYINQPLKTYSSGMKSRLGFAVAVNIEPEILILDEVLSVGDVLFQRKCYAKMDEFFKGGKTIIYVSHNTNSVNELCTRAVLLHNNSIILDSDAKTVTDAYQKILFSAKDASEVINELKKEKYKYNASDEGKICGLPSDLKNNKTNNGAFIQGLESVPNDVNPEVASFNNVCILDDSNQKVNQLYLHKKYKIYYEVQFKSGLENISLGVQIRNNKGVVISGINSYEYMKKKVNHAGIGETFKVVVNFGCVLAPGVYILVVFMEDELGNYAIQYDSFMFEVRAGEFSFGGYVLLDQTMEIEQLDVREN